LLLLRQVLLLLLWRYLGYVWHLLLLHLLHLVRLSPLG
jgi:hypothetical protein